MYLRLKTTADPKCPACKKPEAVWIWLRVFLNQSGTRTLDYQIVRRSSVNPERIGSPEMYFGFSNTSTGNPDR